MSEKEQVADSMNIPCLQQFIHQVRVEARPGHIAQTNDFFRGENDTGDPIRNSLSLHLKYSFQFLPNTDIDRIYGGAYQGVGGAYYSFGDRKQLGNPLALYLFQGARIARLSSCLSLNYEWNFGLSFGWKPYNEDWNDYNRVVGSKTNAYINANFYLNWMLSKRFDLTSGITLTHFSNGGTKYPNAGVNTVGLKLGLVYNFNREDFYLEKPSRILPGERFQRHMSYDLVLFGAWKRKGVEIGDELWLAPKVYTVAGFNFSSMYNLGYKVRVGASLDGVYDGSANVYAEENEYGMPENFHTPSVSKQLALGVSGRIEYVMPYFTVNFGMGVNVLHRGGDQRMFYQLLALKIDVSRNSFLHIGYSLKDFKAPNFLMLGVGYRFNNKPQTYRP